MHWFKQEAVDPINLQNWIDVFIHTHEIHDPKPCLEFEKTAKLWLWINKLNEEYFLYIKPKNLKFKKMEFKEVGIYLPFFFFLLFIGVEHVFTLILN